MKKTEGRKSRDTVPLIRVIEQNDRLRQNNLKPHNLLHLMCFVWLILPRQFFPVYNNLLQVYALAEDF
jgi:hypothetical protein